MKKKHLLISCILFIILSQGIFVETVMAATNNQSVIIGFRHPVGTTDDNTVKNHGGLPKKNFHLIPAVAAEIPENKIADLRNDSNVLYVENVTTFRISDVYSDEYNNSWGVQHINSQVAYDNGINGTGVNVSVLDTGIDYNHPDLKDNYKGGYNFVAFNTNPMDDNCLSLNKECHGTHVSGIIGAEKNGFGVVGVAPNVSLYAVKVLNGGGLGDTLSIISGLEWAVDNKMDIVSMSFSGADDISVHNAVDKAYNAGLLLVAAAGNTNGGNVTYPAGYDSVIAVTATDSSDLNANFAPIDTRIELAAPGVNINSTKGIAVNGGYGILSGTSMAVPHVAGVAALIYSTGIRNNIQVRSILDNTAKDLGVQGRDNIYGYGLVDAQNALGISTPAPTPTPTPTPTPQIYNLTLKIISSKPINDAQRVNLTQGNYTINIHNVNLSEVDMRVYKNGVLQKSLSSDYEFSRKRNDINIDMMVKVPALTFSFIPYGKRGAIGYVNIKTV